MAVLIQPSPLMGEGLGGGERGVIWSETALNREREAQKIIFFVPRRHARCYMSDTKIAIMFVSDGALGKRG